MWQQETTLTQHSMWITLKQDEAKTYQKQITVVFTNLQFLMKNKPHKATLISSPLYVSSLLSLVHHHKDANHFKVLCVSQETDVSEEGVVVSLEDTEHLCESNQLANLETFEDK